MLVPPVLLVSLDSVVAVSGGVVGGFAVVSSPEQTNTTQQTVQKETSVVM